MKYIPNHKTDPSFNLALEEEFLLSEYVTDGSVFSLWRNPPSVIIGVSQIAEQEVNLRYCKENGIPVVRRKTGGGAVYHDLGNLNFSFFFPDRPDLNPYRSVYDLLRPAFQKLGIEIDLSRTNDLLFEGRKFSGMAERVVGDRTMVHGTILYDVDFGTMSNALSTGKSKFSQPKGIRSRHAEVINIKNYLRDIKDIQSLEEQLSILLKGIAADEDLVLPQEFLEKVRNRAASHYAPLNINDIES